MRTIYAVLVVSTSVLLSAACNNADGKRGHGDRGDGRDTLRGHPLHGDTRFLLRRACPAEQCAKNPGAMDSLCAQNVPLNGLLWFQGEGVGPCYCACEALVKLHPSTRDTLHALMLAKENALFRDRARTMAPTRPIKRKRIFDMPDTAIGMYQQLSAMPACNRGRGMLPFQDGCISVDKLIRKFQRAWPVFTVSMLNEDDDWPWSTPTGVDRTDAGPGSPVVSISMPRTFMQQPEVKGELFAFMLAHEISHGMASGYSCHEGSTALICEGQCDWWAANRIMREVFDDETYVSVIAAAAEQMIDYYDDLYGATAECGDPICDCDNPSCGYPPRTCRGKTMRGALRAPPRRPDCVRTWHGSYDTGCEEISGCP
ncbi:MAG: hypothetical protein IPJ76_03515 [Flavobacteriales bacterium]|nr:MAG: hypothetical protein IPJ76_03515 [Flavobacteriales bacterium]